MLKDKLNEEFIEDEMTEKKYYELCKKIFNSFHKESIHIDIEDTYILASNCFLNFFMGTGYFSKDELDNCPVVKTLIDDKGLYGFVLFSDLEVVVSPNYRPFVFSVVLFRQDAIQHVGIDIFNENYNFLNDSFIMQKVKKKIASKSENEIIRLMESLIRRRFIKKHDTKNAGKIQLISRKCAYRKYNSIISKELNICNQKYLIACRKFSMHIRYRIYIFCCIFGDKFYELTYSCPVLAYYIVHSLDITHINKVGNEKLKNVMNSYNTPYCARKLTTADCHYFIDIKIFHLFRMKEFQDIFNNYFPYNNKRLSKIFIKMLNSIIRKVGLFDDHENNLLLNNRVYISKNIVKSNDDRHNHVYKDFISSNNNNYIDFSDHFLEANRFHADFNNYYFLLNVKEDNNIEIIHIIRWFANNFKDIINYNKNVLNRKISNAIVLNDIIDFLMADNIDDGRKNLYSYIDCNFYNVLRMERRWSRANNLNHLYSSSQVDVETTFPEPEFGLWEYEEWKIEPIQNQKDLIEEAFEMQHCVSTYAKKILKGHSYIYSMKKNGERVATIELAGIHVSQARGYCNRTLNNKAISILNKWEKFLKTERVL